MLQERRRRIQLTQFQCQDSDLAQYVQAETSCSGKRIGSSARGRSFDRFVIGRGSFYKACHRTQMNHAIPKLKGTLAARNAIFRPSRRYVNSNIGRIREKSKAAICSLSLSMKRLPMKKRKVRWEHVPNSLRETPHRESSMGKCPLEFPAERASHENQIQAERLRSSCNCGKRRSGRR